MQLLTAILIKIGAELWMPVHFSVIEIRRKGSNRFFEPQSCLSFENRWMLERSQYVVTYVRSDVGGAAQCKLLAEKKGKTVIEL